MRSVSIIIPAYRASRTLPAVLSAAIPQAEAFDAEIVLVESSADGAAEDIRSSWPGVNVIAPSERTLPGRARNLGAEAASGDILVFLDADAIPEPAWLSELLSSLGGRHVAVAGAVGNGTTRSAVGTAGWLLEFSEWFPGGSRSWCPHAASASLAIRAEAFHRAGGFPEDLWPGEDTVLTHQWGATGGLGFAPDAVVRHQNRTAFWEFLEHQRKLGVAFAEVCRHVPFDHAWLSRRPWAAVAGVLRILALVGRLRRRPRERLDALRVAPLLIVGLVAWTVGVWTARA